ncbi:hypothetical protein [Paramagnetospirillum caucaseum]|nr:hypothetical protein [Paramagnetospirillum caucaseum]
MNIFIDLDGVVFRNPNNNVWGGECEISPHALEFLQFSVLNFNCFWLTARDRSGNIKNIEAAFKMALKVEIIPGELASLIQDIRPVYWSGTKTTAIDLESDFYWLDDNPHPDDLLRLESAGRLDRWVEVNTEVNFDDLLRVMVLLEPLSFKR